MHLDDPLWYKDAIIYQLHVKCFYDSAMDGIGDFRGLTEKLDYIHDLGVTAIWLLPFYPSPLKDDGYDISDYLNVHRDYGTLKDIRSFIKQAHRLGLKVITELVVNHTSDQHPWFQAARQAPAGSSKREYYVWSNTDKKFPETRIIFTDTESSNWAWDPVAGAYYWHRFFSHQPDLNHNNPKVVREVIRVMRFWLDMGVDGLRLDAIPYLCVREGTNNENLPETHKVIRQMRAELDTHYKSCMLLAEANQWPEDVRSYFGDGDECHMAFHFPVMPRIFIAVAQEDREPIIDIMNQTPEIPSSCQWAIFLRNHDELTLEMVTDRERSYMYQTYAMDPQMRRNVGICRRLAPLMNNDRQSIKLLSSLLLSFPGTPIIYYGDEIGMGDNIFLGDRNGVRTPMQWSGDRNAGFSRADPARLYLPLIMDPVYGYQAINVEAQDRSPFSLLNWMRRLIAVRKKHAAFGRGQIRFFYPRNTKILAYLREYHDETLLCVANLAGGAQPVELDLREFSGRIPLELMDQTPFPRIGELPYLLTLAGHDFYWFRLATEATITYEDLQPLPSIPFWLLRDSWASIQDNADKFKNEILAPFLQSRHWVEITEPDLGPVQLLTTLVDQEHEGKAPQEGWLLCLFHVPSAKEGPTTLFLPLAISWDETGEMLLHEETQRVLAKVRRGARTGVLHDAFLDPRFCRQWTRWIEAGQVLSFGAGTLTFQATAPLPELDDPQLQPLQHLERRPHVLSIDLGQQLMLEVYRRLEDPTSAELEVGRFLTDVAQFPYTPAVLGAVEYQPATGRAKPVALLQGYVPAQTNGWRYTLDYLERQLEDQLALLRHDQVPFLNDHEESAEEQQASYFALIRTMGQRVGQLHLALNQRSGDPQFDPEPILPEDLAFWRESILQDARWTCEMLQGRLNRGLPEEVAPLATHLLQHREELWALISRCIPATLEAAKSRFHGNFHLGQVIVVQQEVYIIGFTEEQARPGAPAMKKHSPLRDVAGIFRSFNHAGYTALIQGAEGRIDDLSTLDPWIQKWEQLASQTFLEGYFAALQKSPSFVNNPKIAQQLIAVFVLEKALYEINCNLEPYPHLAGAALKSVLLLLEPSTTF